MRRKQLKRVIFSCTVFVILFNLFSPFCYASLIGSPSTQPYMPVCPAYVSAEVLPFGKDTLCVCVEESAYYTWYFMSLADWSERYQEYLLNNTPRDFYDEYTGFFLNRDSSSSYYCLANFYSLEKIVKVRLSKSNQTMVQSVIGTEDSAFPFRYFVSDRFSSSYTRIFCSRSYYLNGHSLDYWVTNYPGTWGSESDYLNYMISQYPTSVSQAVESISEDTALIETYYNILNSRLLTLQDTVNDLSELLMSYGDTIIEQNDINSELITESESNINSHVDEQVSQAVDDINNAGEDISDIDNDIDDVNDIVDTLNEWVSSLDNFADNIDDAEDGVADALEHGKTLMNSFLGVCPPIVIALFTFALVFLVVRKIIGR